MKLRLAGNYWVHSGFFSVLKNLSSILFAFGVFYLLVRTLDKHTFGVWCLFMGTTTLIEFARNGLVSNAFLKFLSSSKKEDYRSIISASMVVTAILTLICMVVNCLIARWLSHVWHMPEVENLFYAFNAIFIVTGITSQFNNIQQANLKFEGSYWSSLAAPAILFGFILFCYLFKYPFSLFSILLVQFIGALVNLGVAYFHTRRYLMFSWKIDKQWVYTLVNYGKFTFGTIMSAIIFTNIDQWMLGAMISPVAVGVYSIAARITSLVEVPTGAMATIVFPQCARRMETEGKEAAKYLYEKSVGTILAILFPGLLILFLFPGFFVHFIAGSDYADSIPVLRITVLYCLLIPYGRQFGTVMDSIGMPKQNFYIVIMTVVSNIIFNYFFINNYGVIGAAYGTLCASIVNFVFCQFILLKHLNIRFINTLKFALNFYSTTIVGLRTALH